MTHVRPFVRPLVRPLVRSGAVGPYGGATYQDGIHLNFASGSSSAGQYVKAPGAAPTVAALTSLFTFTGGNQSMYMGPNGLLVQAVTNVPRIEYDANGNCLGLLMEASRTNLMTFSQDLAGADWSALQSTLSSNSTAAPDGTVTADLVTEDGASSAHGYVNNRTLAVSTTYTTSFWAKANGRTWVAFRATGTGWLNSDQAAFFNISGAGAIGTLGTGITATITAFPNGWYRCTATYATAAAAGTGTGTRIALASADNTQIYAGNSTSGAYFWGVQQEAGAFASSYIPTTTVSVARTACSAIRTLGSEFSATAGTVVVAGRASGGQAVGIGQCVWGLWTDVNNRYTYVRPSASDVARLTINNGGVNQATLDATFTNSASFKAASAWVANDFATTINGTAVLTDGAGTLPAVAVLGLGELGDTSSTMNGHILRFDYWPERRSNAFLRQASA